MKELKRLERVVPFTAKKIHFGIASWYNPRRTSLCGVAQCFPIEADRSSRERNDWKVPDYDNLPVCIKCEDIAKKGYKDGYLGPTPEIHS